jgi:hypothetical protein
MNVERIVNQIKDKSAGLKRLDVEDFLDSHSIGLDDFEKLVYALELVFDDYAQEIKKSPDYNDEDKSRYITVLILDYFKTYGFGIRKETENVED